MLLVDDVADSGRTLALAVELLRDRGADVRSVIYEAGVDREARLLVEVPRRCGSTSPGRSRAPSSTPAPPPAEPDAWLDPS